MICDLVAYGLLLPFVAGAYSSLGFSGFELKLIRY